VSLPGHATGSLAGLAAGAPATLAGTPEAPLVRRLGSVPYEQTLERMRELTRSRTADTRDELWLLEHPAVYTTGQAGREAHFPRSHGGIPLVHTDRGGQVTYHGPGQVVAYVLVDLARRGLKVRAMVSLLEQAVIDTLAGYNLDAVRHSGAPGVYVGDAKVAALGLRVRGGACYHGVSLNVDMDLAPFLDIDPCGYPGMRVTQLADLGVRITPAEAGEDLAAQIMRHLAGSTEAPSTT
jgi:lipoyl(octanoyl) transferase